MAGYGAVLGWPLHTLREVITITTNQKDLLIKLRTAGRSYTDIALTLGIPKNTVKSFCSRNRIIYGGQKIDDPYHCRQCGRRLIQEPKHKTKRFCSDGCRQNWWNSHRELVVKRTAHKTICAHCGIEFISYQQENRKYCSHTCYIKARFGDGHNHDNRAI